MTSTRFPNQASGRALPQQGDISQKAPRTLRAPVLDLEATDLAQIHGSLDSRDITPVIGKTVDITKVTPAPLPPHESIARQLTGLPPSGHDRLPIAAKFAGIERKPPSLLDTLMRRPEAPIWMESEHLDAAWMPGARIAVPGHIAAALGRQEAVSELGPVRFLNARIAPSSLYMAHFGAAVAATVARGDSDMQIKRILPTFSVSLPDSPPVHQNTVVLYAKTASGALEPVAINTDSRVHVSANGDIRALHEAPMVFDLTYTTLENAFAKLIASGAAYSFKPFGARRVELTGPKASQNLFFGDDDGDASNDVDVSTPNNVDAIGQALSAVTGAPTQVHTLADMSQADILATLGERHTAVLITLPASDDNHLAEGEVPKAHWRTYQGETTEQERRDGRTAPEHTLISDVPYAVSYFYPETGMVELVNVLKHSPNAAWYEEDAQSIHQGLAQQKGPTTQIPLTVLRTIVGVEVFASRIPYATPLHMCAVQTHVRTPQGLQPVLVRQPALEQQDLEQWLLAGSTITQKLLEGAQRAWQAVGMNHEITTLLGRVEVVPHKGILLLQDKITGGAMAYIQPVGKLFGWGLHEQQMQGPFPLTTCLSQIANHLSAAEFAIAPAPTVVEPQVSEPDSPRKKATPLLAIVGPDGPDAIYPAAPAPTATPDTPTAAPASPEAPTPDAAALAVAVPNGAALATLPAALAVTALDAAATPLPPALTPHALSPLPSATLAALRDPQAAPRLVGADVAVASLSPQQRKALAIADPRRWYNKVLGQNVDPAYVVDSHHLPVEAVRLGSFTAPGAASVWFKPLSADLIAPSRLELSHFAAALAAFSSRSLRHQRTLTMRSIPQAAIAGSDTGAQQTVVLYAQHASGEALKATPIVVNNDVFAGPDGTVRTVRIAHNADNRERMAKEGSMPFHGYAVLENAFQKLAAHAPQYIFRPFIDQDETGDTGSSGNTAAIAHTLSAVTGMPTQVTHLHVDADADADAETYQGWPGGLQNSDAALITVPMASERFDVQVTRESAGTPSVAFKDATDDVTLVADVPYVVLRRIDTGKKNNPADIRLVLFNVLATADDPTWYDGSAPNLQQILARQGASLGNMPTGQEHTQKNLLTVSLAALQRMSATVYTSAIRGEAEESSIVAAGTPPVQPREVLETDVLLSQVEMARDAVAHMRGLDAASETWLLRDVFFSTEVQNGQPRVHIHDRSRADSIVASFARLGPETRTVSALTQALISESQKLAQHRKQIEHNETWLMQVLNSPMVAQINPHAIIQAQQRDKLILAQKEAQLDQRIGASAALTRGGVRLFGIQGQLEPEMPLAELLQTLAAKHANS